MSSLFDLMRKTNEAQAVRLGIPVSRQFSDDELIDSMQALADAERELYGDMSTEERLGKLSEEEQRMLNELNRRLIPFRVTVTLPDRIEQINILATDACHANIRVVEMVFGDFDAEKPQAFKVKVEPVQTRNLRRAA
jgi:hypothetical protein